MNDGSVCKLLQVSLRGEGIWVRVHGWRGQMENLRHGDALMLRVRREQYHPAPHHSGRADLRPHVAPRPRAGRHLGARRRRLLHEPPLQPGHPYRAPAVPGRLPRRHHVGRGDPGIPLGPGGLLRVPRSRTSTSPPTGTSGVATTGTPTPAATPRACPGRASWASWRRRPGRVAFSRKILEEERVRPRRRMIHRAENGRYVLVGVCRTIVRTINHTEIPS